MFFHIFAHVNPDHILFIIKQIFCQSPSQFCLSNSGWPQKYKTSEWSVWIVNSGACPDNCIRDKINSFVLSHHTLMQMFRKTQQFFSFAFNQFLYRNSGPVCYYLRNVLGINFFLKQLIILIFIYIKCSFLFFFQFRKYSIFQTCCFFQIIILTCPLNLQTHFFNFLF